MKKTEKTEITVAKIVEAAMVEFGTNGYAGGTVNNICKTGINKGLVYHNFSGKDELYLTCFKRSCEKLIAYVHEHDGTRNFDRYMVVRMDFFHQFPNEAHIFFEVLLNPPPHLSDEIQEALTEFNKLNECICRQTMDMLILRDGITTEDVLAYFHLMQTMLIGWSINTFLISGITLNYMLMGVSFAAVFSNIVTPERLGEIFAYFSPILGICLLAAIVDLGAPLDYHLILGAGLYTFVYIFARAFGKYFGAMTGAKIMHMPATVQKYLGLTLLPHSGVSLVFTGIICATLSSAPQLVQIVQGTIAAAAVINEFIAVIAAKKGFELAGEIQRPQKNQK